MSMTVLGGYGCFTNDTGLALQASYAAGKTQKLLGHRDKVCDLCQAQESVVVWTEHIFVDEI